MKFPKCTVSRIVSPGMFVVVDKDKEHVLEVMRMERRMMEEMLVDDNCELQLKTDMVVAVEWMRGKLARGIIQKLDDNMCRVLLMDNGHLITVPRTAVKVVNNSDILNVEPLAFFVKLYGLIPAKYIVRDGIKEPKACKQWESECVEFVKNLLKDKPTILVQKIFSEKCIVYGDLFVKDNSKMKYVSLRKLLCKREFCAYSETAFAQIEGLNVSSCSSGLEKKMEMVQKWQKENFGMLEETTYRLPSPAFYQKASLSDDDFSSSDSSLHDKSTTLPTAESATEEQTSSILFGKPPSVGRGRGKLMGRGVGGGQPGASGGDSPERKGSIENESDEEECKSEQMPKSVTSRLKLLRHLLQARNARMSSSDAPSVPESVKEMDSMKESERVSDAESFKAASDTQSETLSISMQNAAIEPEEFPESADSDKVIEASVSSGKEEPDPPPLVRVGVGKNNEENLKESREDLSVEWKGDDVKVIGGDLEGEKEVDSSPKEETVAEEGPKLEANECWCPRPSEEEQKRPANLMTSSNCWTPFVLFSDSVVNPVNAFRDLPIQPSIIKNLETGGTFRNLSQVQRWAIPAIRKQHNTVVIGSSKTGKTLSYLIPLADYIQDESYFEELPRGNGPSVVILASSSRVCEAIYCMCLSLLGPFTHENVAKSKVKVVLAHGGGREKEEWVTLTNGCDILISTPHCLVRLLEFPVLTNFERLSCLVLDEVDVISQNPFRKQVRIILERVELSTKGRDCQRVMCGEKWTGKVESLVKTYLKTYTVVFGSYAEAVIYERLSASILLVEAEEKAKVLVEKVKNRKKNSKAVIFCESTAEVISLREILWKKGINALIAHERILAERLKETELTWKSSTDSVLLITDGVLNDLDIREAQLLIHYDLPSKSKTNFFLRYFTVLNFYQKTHRFRKVQKQSHLAKPRVIILIDDENHYQLPHIVEFVTRLGGSLPEKILNRCHNIRRLVEVAKHDTPLCTDLLAFGRCRNSKDCPRRHALVKAWDSSEALPTSGWVNFEVVKTHGPCLFSGRLLEHVDVMGKVQKMQKVVGEEDGEGIGGRVLEYLKEEGRRRGLGRVKVGEVCGVGKEGEEGGSEVFYRAKVVEYLKMDRYDNPVEVRVKLLDEGDVWIRKTSELYELPEELAKVPATAVDIRLVGVQPLDFDVSWSHVANAFAKELLNRKLEENQFMSGKIVLALHDTLFLDSVKRKQFLPHLNVHAFDFVLRDELLNNHIAVINPDHLPSLQKLCAEAGIELPRKEDIKKEDSAKVEPQWAFFDEDLVVVRFLAAENTSTVFLQPKKYEKLLEALENECQEEAMRTLSEKQSRKKTKADYANVATGSYCLARFEDGKWNRGRVESETEDEFYIFFVDHGDFLRIPKTDVVPISQRLLLRLPCQAIESRLVTIQHQEECPMEVLQEIYNFSEDGKEELYACIVGKDSKAKITGGRKYDVHLISKKGISLNEMLIDSGMVRAVEEERHHLEKVGIPIEEGKGGVGDEEDEEEEEEEEEEAEEEDEEKEEEKERKDKQEQEQDDFEDIGSGKSSTRLSPAEGNSCENYFTKLTDDVFEDEHAIEFLKEFASKLFPTLGNFENPSKAPREETAAQKAETEKEAKTERKQSIKRGLQLQKERKERELELKSRETVLTPQVLWWQSRKEVRLRILLGNVADYSVECSHRNFSLRCLLGEKLYAVDMRLFGAVSPQMTKVTAKALEVSVVLTKLACPLWPRLLSDDGKHRWISLDVEGLTEKEEELMEAISTAKKEIESGQVKEGFRSDSIRACSDSEEADEGKDFSDSEDSDYELQK